MKRYLTTFPSRFVCYSLAFWEGYYVAEGPTQIFVSNRAVTKAVYVNSFSEASAFIRATR